MKIKLLIISLHYPPDNIIAARRSEAYARHFHKFGVYPTIVTDIVEKVYDENGTWVAYKNHSKEVQPVYEKYETHAVIRLPRFVPFLQRMQLFAQRFGLTSPTFTLIMNLLGHFDMHLLGHTLNYQVFLFQHLQETNYDAILAIDSPHFHIRLAAELGKEFDLPYICDFRDLYDNNILNPNYKPGLNIRFRNVLKKRFFENQLKNVTFVAAATEPWAAYYSTIAKRPGYCITNGYEPGMYVGAAQKTSDEFVISHTGRLYQNQNWEVFSKGISLFLQGNSPKNFKITFAGVRKDALEILKKIRKDIPGEYLNVKKWIEREEVYNLQNVSSVFVGSYLEGTVGHYPGKLFEYLGARKPILFAPGDKGGVVDQLLLKTKAGITANTPEEVCNFITLKYNEWREAGQVRYDGIEKEINKYTREEQVKRMSILIKRYCVDNEE